MLACARLLIKNTSLLHMTIDTAWLACFKEEAPSAFTPRAPFHASAVFSDGQIRLMQNAPEGPQTWNNYIFNRSFSGVFSLLQQHR